MLKHPSDVLELTPPVPFYSFHVAARTFKLSHMACLGACTDLFSSRCKSHMRGSGESQASPLHLVLKPPAGVPKRARPKAILRRASTQHSCLERP